jgi:ABC-type taurine transport system ATPase subunit
MDALVQIDDVTRRYDGSGRPAVDGMTLEIAPGDAMAVMGPFADRGNGGRNTVTPVLPATAYNRPEADLKRRVHAMRRRRRLPTEAQGALVIRIDRRTGDD